MKRIHLLLLSLLTAFAGCVETVDEEPAMDFDGKQEVVIEAVLADESDTKTVYNESDGFVYWKPGDEINVFFGVDSGKFTSINECDAKKAAFSGTLTVTSIVGLSEGETHIFFSAF